MVDGDGEVVAAQYKVACLVEGVRYGKCFPFDGGVAGLRWVGESAANQGDSPSLSAAEQVRGGALAVLLEKPVPYAVFGPVCGEAGWFGLVIDGDPVLDLRNDG